MNDSNQTRFEQKLNAILASEEEAKKIVDGLDDEDKTIHLPATVEYKQIESVVDNTESNLPKDLIEDYKHARNTLYGLIERGTVALEGSLIIARESEHPRAFEVASNLMRNISEITKDLINLQKAMTPEVKIGKQINQQNNFYGNKESDSSNVNNLLDDLDDD